MVTKVNKAQTTLEDDFLLVDLADAPDSYTGHASKVVAVTATEDGIEFVTVGGGGGPVAWTDLTDTVGALGSEGQHVVVSGGVLDFEDPPPAPTVPDEVKDMTDVPDYASEGGKLVKVNSGGTGWEYISSTSLTLDIGQVGFDSISSNAGKFAVVNEAEDAVEWLDQQEALDLSLIDVRNLAQWPSAVAGRFLRSKADGTLEWATVDAVGSFVDLDDTPSQAVMDVSDGYTLVVNAGGVGVTPTVTPRTEFTELDDTPSSLSGQAGKILEVNSTGDALVLVAPTPSPLIFPVGDESTTLTTGVKATYRAPQSFSVGQAKASLTTAPDSTVDIDVKVNGVSMFSTRPNIDAGQEYSRQAAQQPVIANKAISEDAEITVEVISAGSGTPSGLKVYLIHE